MIDLPPERKKCLEHEEVEYMMCIHEDCKMDDSECQRRCAREMEVCSFSLHRLFLICLFVLLELYLFGRLAIK